MEKFNSLVKNFVVGFGKPILNVVAVLSFIVDFIVSIVVMIEMSFGYGVAFLIISYIVLFLSFLMIYLIVDIRDALVEQNKNQK